jgi:hypothetical protein
MIEVIIDNKTTFFECRDALESSIIRLAPPCSPGAMIDSDSSRPSLIGRFECSASQGRPTFSVRGQMCFFRLACQIAIVVLSIFKG